MGKARRCGSHPLHVARGCQTSMLPHFHSFHFRTPDVMRSACMQTRPALERHVSSCQCRERPLILQFCTPFWTETWVLVALWCAVQTRSGGSRTRALPDRGRASEQTLAGGRYVTCTCLRLLQAEVTFSTAAPSKCVSSVRRGWRLLRLLP